ncbi:efflux ABC transporter, permease protein [Leptospira ryugenii]|uniref:Efflux ABC transporter, permease protein n=1 Tax=Leptospira ryugenii TaxID=1917863 RepID=A0A2P2DZ30_9LEPT|nr:FtsX-like permease family protein [Leptospira ryugenii]GBF49875.1 efflux ABC transporter, permease protein [Leptospira ryugenii]
MKVIWYYYLWKYHADNKQKMLLSLVSIALGISLFFTTQVNSWRAEESFIDSQIAYSGENFVGQMEHFIPSDDFDLKDLAKILPNGYEIDPILQESIYFRGDEDQLKSIPILGKDIFAYTIFPENQKQSDFEIPILMSEEAFAQLFAKGDAINIQICQQKIDLTKNKVSTTKQSGAFLLTDITTIQKICGKTQQYSKIVIYSIVPNQENAGFSELFFEKIKKHSITWETREGIREKTGKALGSLKINLLVVSLVSVLISFFMITNAFSSLFYARKKEFGILLSLGNSRFSNFVLFAVQAFVLGLVGSILGVLLGTYLIDFPILSSSNTITDEQQIRSYHNVPDWIYLSSLAIGSLGALAAALSSSWKSYQIQAIELVRERSEDKETHSKVFLYSFWVAILFVLIGITVGLFPKPQSIIYGLLGVGFIIIGTVLLLPMCIQKAFSFLFAIFPSLAGKALLRISWEEIRREPLHNSITVSTIFLSIALVFTLQTLTDSYESSLLRWVEEENPFDYSLIDEEKLATGEPGIPISLYDEWKNKYPEWKLEPFIIQPKFPVEKNYYTLHAYPFSSKENEIMVSNNFCYLEKKCDGDFLTFHTEKRGMTSFRIKAVKEHFFSERGTIMMSSDHYDLYFKIKYLNSLRIQLPTGANRSSAEKELQNQVKKHKSLKLLNQNELKNLYVIGMRQVFKSLDLLKLSSIFLTMLSLLNALLYQIKEKGKLLASLRAIGMDKFQLFQFVFFQSAFLTGFGFLIGVLNSALVAPVVVFGINKNAFGWSLDFRYPISWLGIGFFLVPVLATFVSLLAFASQKNSKLSQDLK